MADWSTMPRDILIQIVKKLYCIDDFVVFGAVCKSWQAAAVKKNFNASMPWLLSPWLLFPSKKESCIYELFNPSTQISRHIRLREADGTIWFSSQGWLMIAHRNGTINLLHPLSNSIINLPQLGDPPSSWKPNYLLCHAYANYVHKVVISSKIYDGSDFEVMVIHDDRSKLSLYRHEDKSWTRIKTNFNDFYFYKLTDLVYYKNQYYVFTNRGQLLMVCEGSNNTYELSTVTIFPPELCRLTSDNYFLVESGGELLMVVCQGHERIVEEYEFQVFRIDFGDGRNTWIEVKDLGSRALFLGRNSSFSIEASPKFGYKPNCIYYADNVIRSRSEDYKRVLRYDMQDGSAQRLFNNKSVYRYTPPLWIVLDFYE